MEAKTQVKKRKTSVFMIITGVVLGLYVLSIFVLLLWGILTSLKSDLELDFNRFGLPGMYGENPKLDMQFSNYSNIFKYFTIKVVKKSGGTKYVYIEEMFFNGILYALGCAVIQAFVQYIIAYISSRFKYKACKIFYWIAVFTMILPTVGTTASGLYVAKVFNLDDSILGMYIMKANFLGVYFLVFYAQLAAFPKDYAEAARIDGAGNFTVMMGITFPLVRNTFITIALLLFVAYWNDYTTPMLYMPNVPTLAFGLYWLCLENSVADVIKNVPSAMAGCVMMLIPMLILFLLLHKRLMGNLSMGGLKE